MFTSFFLQRSSKSDSDFLSQFAPGPTHVTLIQTPSYRVIEAMGISPSQFVCPMHPGLERCTLVSSLSAHRGTEQGVVLQIKS